MRARTLLRLLQVSDSTFPTGSFSHSLGLEAFAEAGELRDAEDLRRLVGLHLHAMATSDCVALRASWGAGLEDLLRIDKLLSATKLSRELRVASSSTGKRFLLSVAALGVEDAVLESFTRVVRDGDSPGNVAVGYGAAAPALGLDPEEALLSYLFASTAALVSAGQKLVPLGGSVAQRVLYELGEEMVEAAEVSQGLRPEDMHAFAPEIDVRSMLHERQKVRLYIS